jgi:acyl carrier protein
MKKSEFLCLIDDIIESPPGTVREDQRLEDLEGWDSLAVVSFIAAINQSLGVTLSAEKLQRCKTVPDLLHLVGGRVEA